MAFKSYIHEASRIIPSTVSYLHGLMQRAGEIVLNAEVNHYDTSQCISTTLIQVPIY